jgi:putative transposase
MSKKKQYDNGFKARVALEAIKNERTIAQIGSEYGVHPNQVSQWKKRVLEALPGIFSTQANRDQHDSEVLADELYRQIGQLKVELDWLQKKTRQLH